MFGGTASARLAGLWRPCRRPSSGGASGRHPVGPPSRSRATDLSDSSAGDIIGRVRSREFPHRSGAIFLNTASWGLIPRTAAEEAADLLLRRNRPGGFAEAEFRVVQRRCRDALATLLGVDTREIALVQNTSYGVSLGAAAVSAGPPGTVVVSQGEFPANVLPWMALERRGFKVRRVPTDVSGCPREDLIADALDGDDVRALAISAVQYSTGYRVDLPALGEMCRDRGILFCVDAIQALGAVGLRPREAHVDVLASGGQKWLCAAWGSGFAYVAKELQDRFPPPMASWLGVRGGGQLEEIGEARLEWVDSARRFELATVGLQDHLTLARSVEILLEMGVDRITRYLHGLHGPVLEWAQGRPGVSVITPRDAGRRAGILTLAVPEPHRVLGELEKANVTCAVRGGALRFSPHYYNEIGEMDEVVRILDAVVPG